MSKNIILEKEYALEEYSNEIIIDIAPEYSMYKSFKVDQLSYIKVKQDNYIPIITKTNGLNGDIISTLYFDELNYRNSIFKPKDNKPFMIYIAANGENNTHIVDKNIYFNKICHSSYYNEMASFESDYFPITSNRITLHVHDENFDKMALQKIYFIIKLTESYAESKNIQVY